MICGYADSRLVSGTLLTAAETTALTAALNRLPARYTAAQRAIQTKLPPGCDACSLRSSVESVPATGTPR